MRWIVVAGTPAGAERWPPCWSGPEPRACAWSRCRRLPLAVARNRSRHQARVIQRLGNELGQQHGLAADPALPTTAMNLRLLLLRRGRQRRQAFFEIDAGSRATASASASKACGLILGKLMHRRKPAMDVSLAGPTRRCQRASHFVATLGCRSVVLMPAIALPERIDDKHRFDLPDHQAPSSAANLSDGAAQYIRHPKR